MKKFFVLILVFSTFFSVKMAEAQDPRFSQFFSNPIWLSPSLAGTGQGPRLAMNYRTQWAAIPGAFKTFAMGFDMPLYLGNTNQGVGLFIMQDKLGEALAKLDVTASYSFHVPITDNHSILLGVSGGFQQTNVDFNRFKFPDQIDPQLGFVNTTSETPPASLNRITPDVNAGITYYNKYVYLGYTASHITQPQQRVFEFTLPDTIDSKLPMKHTAFGGADIPVNDKISIAPAVLYQLQKDFSQINVGMYVNVKPIVLGFWYNNDQVTGLFGFKQGSFSFGYSYDYTISDLTNKVSGGSHEISLMLQIPTEKKKKIKHQKLPCPKF